MGRNIGREDTTASCKKTEDKYVQTPLKRHKTRRRQFMKTYEYIFQSLSKTSVAGRINIRRLVPDTMHSFAYHERQPKLGFLKPEQLWRWLQFESYAQHNFQISEIKVQSKSSSLSEISGYLTGCVDPLVVLPGLAVEPATAPPLLEDEPTAAGAENGGGG